jgi:putative membrane protein
MTPAPATPLDTGTRLAADRTRLAYERTLMAWVRTATSLISFGFTIYKFFEFESARGTIAPASSRLLTPRQFGMIMIGTGLIALALATMDHYRNIRRMRDEFGPTGRSVSMAVAAIVSVMGILALIAALVRG